MSNLPFENYISQYELKFFAVIHFNKSNPTEIDGFLFEYQSDMNVHIFLKIVHIKEIVGMIKNHCFLSRILLKSVCK